jgi:DNA-binding MarR family transcriptional regulator
VRQPSVGGLLRRDPDPADRRRVLVEMTGSGKETLERLP